MTAAIGAGEILRELESLGSEQTRKTYRRHGVGENQYGVSYANLGKLKKRIKVDHDLAVALWASGNHDARILATMIADPTRADRATLDAWVRDLSNYVTTDTLADLAARSPVARDVALAWADSDDDWIGSAGWTVLARLAAEKDSLPDAEWDACLDEIERTIHDRKNRTRYAMNNALIATGLRDERLEEKALAVAAHIGRVEVDHGQTNCTTPDAAGYIRKTLEHRRKKRTDTR